ncbi:MAG TPA: glycosyltransferase family 2 protein [Pyrinomonadaceae bacterium]|jgi:glycosyltransferase involved in cell wall biosynthesis
MASAAKANSSRKIFSIVLATYNCGRKVEPTIESILGQNKDLFELIVLDGASTDDTLDCIKKYESDLTLISEKDAGVYDAFNKGIDLATGEYLYFIGAGDKLREGVLETVSEFLPLEVTAFVYGDAYVVKEQIHYGGEYDESRLQKQNICHQAVFYHRDIFALLGKYELRYSIFSDWALNLKCFGNRRIRKQYLERVIVDFEGGGLSSTDGDADFKKDFPRLVRNYLGLKSYIAYRSPLVSSGIYWKIYFPFVRPLVSALRKLKNGRRES